MKRIYVGNLAWSTTEDELRQVFSECGSVHSATVISDRQTGRSRGFGFIEMENSDADSAISQINGKDLGGRELRVNEARERTNSGGGGDRW